MYLSDSINHSIYQKVNLENIINFYKTQKSDKKFHKARLSIETPIHVMLDSKHVFHYHSISSLIISAISKNKLNTF